MRIVQILSEGPNGTPAMHALSREIAEMRGPSQRLYSTYSEARGKPCVLCTTSGQIQLQLSRLSQDGLKNLCQILVEEVDGNNKDHGFMLASKMSQIFVTPFREDDSRFHFHLAPAGGGGHDDGLGH